MKAFGILGLIGCLILALVGCGGGGTSTSGGQSVTGESAAVTAAQGAFIYSGGQAGSAGSPRIAAPNAGTDPSSVAPFYRAIGQLALASLKPKPQASSGWVYDPNTGLYYEVTSKTGNSVEILFSTNGTSNNAGNVTATIESGGNGVYPESVSLNLDLIFANETISGTITVTIYDSAGTHLNLQMALMSSTAGVAINCNLTELSGTISGTFAISKGASSLVLSQIVATASSFAADFTIGNVYGGVTVSSDGSGVVHSFDSTGEWTLTWDAALNATLTGPNNFSETGNLMSLT